MSIGEKMILKILNSMVSSSPPIRPPVAVEMLQNQVNRIKYVLHNGDGDELSIEIAQLAILAIKVMNQ